MMNELIEEIVNRVSEATGQEPTTLPPLGETIDTEALEQLAADGARIQFEYIGYTVVVEKQTVTLETASDSAHS